MITSITIKVNTSFVGKLALFVFFLEDEVPFFFEEVRKYSHPEWSKLMKNIRKQGSVMDFEVKTGLIGKPKNLFENESNIFDEERINKGVNNFSVLVSGMLVEDNVILNKEMRDVVIQVDCFRNCIHTNDFIATLDCKT